MRNFHNAEVSAASGQDGIDFVTCCKVATDYSGNTRFVAQPIAEGGQKATAIGWFTIYRCLARQYLKHITSMCFQSPGDDYCILDGEASLHTIGNRERDRDRLVLRPGGSHGIKYLQWEAQTPFQVTAGEVKVQQVKASFLRQPGRTNELIAHLVHSGTVHLPRNLALRRVRDGRGREEWPVAPAQRSIQAF